MQRIIFALICALLLIKPTSNALFLSILGIDYLPVAYLGVALTALFISFFYNNYSEQKNARQIFVLSSVVSIVVLLLIAALLILGIQKNIVVFIFYLFVSVFGILSASQFWIISNQIFNARQARKYFGVIGSGAIAGGISGGYIASAVSTIFQSEYILIVACFFIMYAIYEVLRLDRERLTQTASRSASDRNTWLNQFLKPFKLISGTRHLGLIALMVALSVFVAKLIDYQFGYFATRAYPIEEELTSFYGFWYSSFNLVSLVIQLFLTTRIVGKFGVGHSILILPVMLLFGTMVLLVFPALLFALLIKLLDSSMKQSINKASAELIMLPIPEDIKLKTKTFIDVFIDSLATGFCGIMILVFINAIELPNYVISFLILFGVCAWLYISNNLRKEYKSVFRQSLRLRSDQVRLTELQLRTQYESILLNGNHFQKIKTLRLLKNSELEIGTDVIEKLLKSERPELVVATINILLFDKNDFSVQLRQLLNHPDQDVRSNAFEYLINHQESLETHFLLKHLHSEDKQKALMAITAYSREFGNNPAILRVLEIHKKLTELIEEYNSHPDNFTPYQLIGMMKSISYGKFTDFYPFIDRFMHSDERILRDNAHLAAGETGSAKFFKILSEEINSDTSDIEIQTKALSKFGLLRLRMLCKDLVSKNKLIALRKIPFALSRIPKEESLELLRTLLDHDDLIVRNNAIQALSELSDKYPLLRLDNREFFSILISEARYNNAILKFILDNSGSETDKAEATQLIEILKSKIDSNLKIIFELLNIIYPPEDFLELYDYVKGADYTLRNNAIEYMDNALHPDLKSVIVPLVEYNFNDTRPRVEDVKLDEAYIRNFLLSNRDPEIREAALEYYES